MRSISVFVVVLIVVGCTATQQHAAREFSNDRIVYRDLTQPKEVHYPIAPPTQQSQPPTESQPQANQASGFIEFANDSTTEFDEKGLAVFADALPSGTIVLVVGHSHGQSAVRVANLATRRAETIQRWLEGRGHSNVHTMASWGVQAVAFAPNRGVHLYVLTGQSDVLPIAFAKEIKETNRAGDQVSDGIAYHHSAKADLNNI